MMKSMTIKLILMAMAILSVGTVLAQGPPGPPRTPIDGGLGLLLAGGAIYGVKKIREHRSKRVR